MSSSQVQLHKIADVMSYKSMKSIDESIIGEILTHVKLEQDMPKLTEKIELVNYSSPTMLLVSKKDIFFPAVNVMRVADTIIPNLVTTITYEMGHFPSQELLKDINNDIKKFLDVNYQIVGWTGKGRTLI
ncbi:alpha/beta fold hydrolase [Paenibacillus macquariensis]|nr:alpha/beta hydrolase [Paenibacillus macquariensis]